jgi:TRAP-type C4-dicarboxylate transport system permease small subunit
MMGHGMVRMARIIHLVSAWWALGLAVIIGIDVTGRAFFGQPLPGTREIIQNSVVAITFLQLPLAIFTGSMLRTTIFADAVGPLARRTLRTIGALLGIVFFIGVLVSSWEPMLEAWRIGEYEGEGALRVPTYPVRVLLVATAAFAAMAYALMIVFDWSGRLEDEESVPAEMLR